MASRIQGITVEIGGATTKLSKALGYYVSVAKRLSAVSGGTLRNRIEINCAVWLVFFVGSQLPQQRKTGNRNCAFPMIDNI